MANLSFAEWCFPTAFKTAQVLPLLKKAGLDKTEVLWCATNRCLHQLPVSAVLIDDVPITQAM